MHATAQSGLLPSTVANGALGTLRTSCDGSKRSPMSNATTESGRGIVCQSRGESSSEGKRAASGTTYGTATYQLRNREVTALQQLNNLNVIAGR
eukprot:6184482-Pleurochrysis_carterae.AAC.1